MLGLAVGCIGMSRSEFAALTPEEFNAIAEQWHANDTRHYRSGWEQARFVALCCLTPYSKRALKPTDIIRFDWETLPEKNNTPLPSKEDFERLKKEYG